tara:strand:- start:3965 stop:6175 length:2211 start_codon:yes stop_codon:yes gene_type:complete
MSYKEVLRNLSAGEQRNADRFREIESVRLAEDRERGRERLAALSTFSDTLDGFVKSKAEDFKEKEILRGKLAFIEQDIESKEATGKVDIPQEDIYDYESNLATITKNKEDLDSVAVEVLEDGGSFQQADEISNLSGWALYSFVQQKSKIAADNYEDWLKGEMINNEDIKLEVNGKEFTPKTAETLDQKNIAMKALRRQYLLEQNLTDVNRALLDDKNVGFYDKVQSAHKNIMKDYEKNDAIDKSFKVREDAVNSFAINKNFKILLDSVKRTVDENNKPYSRAEALDEVFTILTDMAKTGQLTEDDLKAIQEQEIMIDGKPYKVSRWKTRWLKLGDEVTEYQNEVIENEIKQQELKGDKFTQDVLKEEAELKKDGKRFTEEQIKEKLNQWDPQWGTVPTKLKDILDRTEEDRDDEGIIEDLEFRQRRNLPINQEDVDKIKDTELWNTWSKKVTQSNATSLKKEEVTNFTNRLNTRLKNKFKLKNDGDTKPNGYWDYHDNALADFHRIYKDNVDKFGKEKAFDIAKKQVLDNLDEEVKIDGVTYDYYEQAIDPDPEMTLNKDLEIATYAIKTNGSKAITKSVLPGTEDYLKRFIDSDGKDLPEIYQLIANQHNRTKYPPVSATDIARQQASLVGKDEIPKSEIEKQLDELPEYIRSKLLVHPDQERVNRAKIDLLAEDGDISYNDVQFLIDEVAEYYATPEGKAILDRDFPLGKETVIEKDKPNLSDTKARRSKKKKR